MTLEGLRESIYEMGLDLFLDGFISEEHFYSEYWPRRPCGPPDERLPEREVKHYDPSNVTFTFNGIKLQGYSDGTFVKMNGDNFQCVDQGHSNEGTVNITLMSQAPNNWTLLNMFYSPSQLKKRRRARRQARKQRRGWA